MRKVLSILGSTGSIGTQALDVCRAFPERFSVGALAARRSWELLARQALEFRPRLVALADEEHLGSLKEALSGSGIEVRGGSEGIRAAAELSSADLVLSALVGVAGLVPTVAALEAGKPVALANKEALVVGGELVTRLAARKGCPLLPVDSEHSAIFQCLQGQERRAVKRILLTASGGPFRTCPRERLGSVTAADALQHPTWDMGAKITIDSATLMNKGFEVLEAMFLFGVSLDQVEVWVHPQSIIHSMVEFVDGSVLAQMGPPDMRTPIQYALGYPERLPRSWAPLELRHLARLTFEAPRHEDFPALGYAYAAGRAGGTMPAVLNAANEVAVQLFLEGKIGFLDIAEILRRTMESHTPSHGYDLPTLLEVDRQARHTARQVARQLGQLPVNSSPPS
ncbi:MAG TPA: 1-deoxy-D-xylulose-5-phosphate reductoisomerase [Candidatus Nitrosotenuis sp.]|nr:1-deoxy-D-xylulose-5-phosphate reductoisomerase [Candidatus Nitrosotenuis sp.]